MSLNPLKIKISKSQKQIARAAITEYQKRNEPILGNEPPSIVGDMLVADPTDFVCLMAFAHPVDRARPRDLSDRLIGKFKNCNT